MAGMIERLIFQIEVQNRNAKQELDALGKAAQQTGQQMDTAASKAANLGVAMAAAFGGVQIARGLNATVQAAGRLTNVIATAQQVFGDSYDVIEQFSNAAVDSVGLSKTAATQAATFLGGLGKAAGLAGDELADFSIALTALGADLAAAFNTSVEDATKAIQSGFSGSSIEPLREYNVVINDTILKQEYLALTGEKVAGTLSTQQRMIAFVSVLSKQTADYQGQWAREADQLLGSQQRLNAEWQNMQANLGQGLEPALAALTNAGIAALGVFNAMPQSVQSLTGILVGAAGAAVALNLAAQTGTRVLDALGTSAATTSRIMGVATKASGLLAAAVVVGGLAAEESAKQQKAYARSIDDIVKAIGRGSSGIREFRDLLTEDRRGWFGKLRDEVIDAFRFDTEDFWNEDFDRDPLQEYINLLNEVPAAARAIYDEVIQSASAARAYEEAGLSVEMMEEALRNWRLEQRAAIDAEREMASFVEDGILGREGLAAATEAAAAATERLTERTESMASAFGDVRDETEDARDALQDYIDAARGEIDSAFDPAIARLEAAAAIRDEAAALDELNKVRKEGGDTIDAELDYLQRRQDAASAVAELVDAQVRGWENYNDVALTAEQRWQAQIDAAREMATQFPELADGLRLYIDELTQNPPTVEFATDTAQLDEAARRIGELVDRDYVVDLLVSQGFSTRQAQDVWDRLNASETQEFVVKAVIDAAEAEGDLSVLEDEQWVADVVAEATIDAAEQQIEDFVDAQREIAVGADISPALAQLRELQRIVDRGLVIPVRTSRSGGGGGGTGNVPISASPFVATSEQPLVGFRSGAPAAVRAGQPVSTTYVTVNLPPASEPDAVVGAIQQWARRNGSIYAPVD